MVVRALTLSMEPATRGNMPFDVEPYNVRYRSPAVVSTEARPLRSGLRVEGQDQRLDFSAVVQSRDDAKPAVLVQ